MRGNYCKLSGLLGKWKVICEILVKGKKFFSIFTSLIIPKCYSDFSLIFCRHKNFFFVKIMELFVSNFFLFFYITFFMNCKKRKDFSIEILIGYFPDFLLNISLLNFRFLILGTFGFWRNIFLFWVFFVFFLFFLFFSFFLFRHFSLFCCLEFVLCKTTEKRREKRKMVFITQN